MPALGELLQGGGGRGQHQGVGLVDQVDEPGWGGLQLAAAADELAAVQAGEVGAELVGGSDDQSMKGVHGLGAGFDGRGADHAQHADGLDGAGFCFGGGVGGLGEHGPGGPLSVQWVGLVAGPAVLAICRLTSTTLTRWPTKNRVSPAP
jgi:hypothetical protein